MVVVARTAPDPATMERAIRRAVETVDPSLPIANVATMDALMTSSRAAARFNTLLLSVFGAIALLLASVGVYGVVAYSVRQRAREIALRMALGATDAGVAKLLVRRALTPIVLGAVVGVALATATTPLLRDQLYGVAPGDLMTLTTVTVLLLLVSLGAVCIPAWRAMRISPARALAD
jgi:ABC-type antimicrobial peptide transport system permease subunit